MPIGLQGSVFYYNKQLFKKAGLPTEFEPENWDEVIEAGEKLEAAGIQPLAGGAAKEGAEGAKWLEAGWQTENTPEQAVELAEGEMPFTDEAVTRALELQVRIDEAGLYPDDYFTTPPFPDGTAAFVEGEAGMYLGFWNTAGYWGEFTPTLGEENVGMFFAPGSTYIGALPSIALSIPSFADNKDAAWALIEYTASKEGMETLYDLGGFLPNNSEVTLPADAPAQAQELVRVIQEEETAPGTLIMVEPAVLFGPMSTEMNQVLQGRTSLEDAQQAMQETAAKSG